MKNRMLWLLTLCLVMCGCADGFDQDIVNTALQCTDPGGFWWGLWNGMTSGIAFIVSLFTDDISCYDACNTGGWYWFGFLLGAGSSLKVTTSAAKQR